MAAGKYLTRTGPHGIIIKEVPNLDIRSFELGEGAALTRRGRTHFSYVAVSTEDLTEEGITLLDRLLSVPGVDNVTMKKGRELDIERAKAFDWTEVESRILRVLLNDPSYGEVVSTPPRILIENFPNPNILTFNSTVRLSALNRSAHEADRYPPEGCGPVGEAVLGALASCNGVSGFTLERYGVTVTFSGVPTGPQVDGVNRVLKQHFPDANVEITWRPYDPEDYREEPEDYFG